MKKLLAILAMLLALLMIGVVAVAEGPVEDDDPGSSTREGIPYEDIRRVHTLDNHDVELDRVIYYPTCTERGLARYTCMNDPTHFHEAYIKAYGHYPDPDKPYTYTNVGTKDVCCIETYICGRCGQPVSKEIKAHEWASKSGKVDWGKVTKEPTCQEPGEAIDYCLVCGLVNDFVKPREIAKLPHEYKDVEVADCLTEDVIVYQQCKFCGEFLLDKDGEKAFIKRPKEDGKDYHDWDEWVKESDATCSSAESWVRFCKRCGDKQEKLVGDPLEIKWVVKPDSILKDCFKEKGIEICEYCQGKVEGHTRTFERKVEAHVYKFEKKYQKGTTVKPTCTEKGYTEYWCIYGVNDDSHPTKKVYTDALGHQWSDWELRVAPNQGDNEYGYWIRECTREGCHVTEEKIAKHQPPEMCEGKHDFIVWADSSVEPTCTEGGKVTYVCTKCGTEKVEEAKALGHDLVEEVVIQPTCAKEGKKLISCTRCDYLKTVAIEKLAHTEVTLPAVAATCLTDGWTEGKECSACGATLVAREKIPAVGHHDYVKVDAVEPTCTEVGYTAGTKCSVCGDVLVAPVEIPAKGHTVVEVAAVEPTCTKAGSTAGKTCSVCNEVIEAVKEVPATGHKWDDGKITKEATPTEDGVKTFTCTACGETRTEAVPFEFDEEAAYELVDMKYSDNKITGKAVHEATTVESDKLYARVTVFFVGGTYAVFADYVEDGVIDIEIHGTVLAVSVNLTGSKNVVPGSEMVIFDTWNEY